MEKIARVPLAANGQNTVGNYLSKLNPTKTKIIAAVLTLIAAIIYFIKILPLTKKEIRFDDAYMFARYANNIINGFGYAWNPNHVNTYGCTSIPFTYLVVIGKLLFPNASNNNILMFFSIFWGIAAVIMLVVTARYVSSKKYSHLKALLVVLIVGVVMPRLAFVQTSVTGMDTTLSVFSNALFIFLVIRASRIKSFASILLAAFSGYFIYLVRPDNALYAGFFPFLFLKIYAEKKWSFIFRFYFSFGALLLIDTLIKYLVFGDPIPLTYYAKTSGFFEGYLEAKNWNQVDYIRQFLRYNFPFVAIIFLLARKKHWRLLVAFLVPMLITFLYFFRFVQVMGGFFRYYFPSMAYLIILAAILLNDFLKEVHVKDIKRVLLKRVVVFALITTVFYFSIDNIKQSWARTIHEKQMKLAKPFTRPVKSYGWWATIKAMDRICKKLPAGSLVSASEHGYFSASNPTIHILDIAGLHDPTISHKGFSTDYLFSRKPVVIWMPHYFYTSLHYKIENDPQFKQLYNYYPNAMDYGVAVLKTDLNANRAVSEVLKSVNYDPQNAEYVKDFSIEKFQDP